MPGALTATGYRHSARARPDLTFFASRLAPPAASPPTLTATARCAGTSLVPGVGRGPVEAPAGWRHHRASITVGLDFGWAVVKIDEEGTIGRRAGR